MEITEARASDLTDSAGASARLTERFGRSFGADSVRMLVKSGKIRSFQFEEGVLTERTPDAETRGKDLLFLRADLEAVEVPPRPGRRWTPKTEAGEKQ